MPIKDLRNKYGQNLKSRQAVNAAIRAELVGGEDVLDALALLHRVAVRLRKHQSPLATDADKALDAARELADAMSDEIARRYGLS